MTGKDRLLPSLIHSVKHGVDTHVYQVVHANLLVFGVVVESNRLSRHPNKHEDSFSHTPRWQSNAIDSPSDHGVSPRYFSRSKLPTHASTNLVLLF